jgi:Na+/phosphate symporter
MARHTFTKKEKRKVQAGHLLFFFFPLLSFLPSLHPSTMPGKEGGKAKVSARAAAACPLCSLSRV